MEPPAQDGPAGDPAEPARHGPIHRLDEALKQIEIASEVLEDDVGEELRAAAAELEAARSAITADD